MDNIRTLALRLFYWMQGRDAEQHRQQQAHERTMADGLQRQYQDPDTWIQRQQSVQAVPPPGRAPSVAAQRFDAQIVALQERLALEQQQRQLQEQQRRLQSGG